MYLLTFLQAVQSSTCKTNCMIYFYYLKASGKWAEMLQTSDMPIKWLMCVTKDHDVESVKGWGKINAFSV